MGTIARARILGAFVVVVVSLATGSLKAEDWTTTDGKVYRNVTVLKAEPDAITILYRDGGALVPLAILSPELQKRFNYDPAAAKAATDARAKSDATSAAALQAEQAQAAKIKAAQDAKDKAEQKRLADLKRKNEHHDGMPSEPEVLERDKKVNDDVFNPQK